MTHTPGPWVNENGTIKAANHYHIAHISAPYHMHNETTLANARLIAAAPVLLAELKRVVAYLDRNEGPDISWLPETKTAIAKVEGKS